MVRISYEKLNTGMPANVIRLVVVANFVTVNFRLLLNFLRKINVILLYILPLLQTDVSGIPRIINKLNFQL